MFKLLRLICCCRSRIAWRGKALFHLLSAQLFLLLFTKRGIMEGGKGVLVYSALLRLRICIQVLDQFYT
jgi:hypothetical protein